jgi:hypothetical protein
MAKLYNYVYFPCGEAEAGRLSTFFEITQFEGGRVEICTEPGLVSEPILH